MTDALDKTGASFGVQILGNVTPAFSEILTPDALKFVADLTRQFSKRRCELLKRREVVQKKIDSGWLPDFLPETESVRLNEWCVAPIPKDLLDRRVEITGPVDRKMIINALNSGANVFMADCEDSHSPTWEATMLGQINLRDAVLKRITYESPDGKCYRLNDKTAVLFVRPRGWHLNEKQLLVDGEVVPAGIFDFGLYLYHNAHELLNRNTGPYFYLPKLENHLEARLWNDIFVYAQKAMGLPEGTIRATVLIETILAAFEMNEILYELRDHSSGLNCGRWDYIFSMIKKFRNNQRYIFPDRSLVTMTTHCMQSYSLLTIQTCHRRGVHAIGGMAAQIPIKNNPVANKEALNKVFADKQREVSNGHDGTWVAHPGLVPIAREAFDAVMKTENQIEKKCQEIEIKSNDLLTVPKGRISEKGLRTNINVGIRYLESWLRGVGCVPLYNLMEDAATAEISRAQVWQWIRHPDGVIENGKKITLEMVDEIIREECMKMKSLVGEANYSSGKYNLAADLFRKITRNESFEEFLTLRAYEHLNS